MPPDASSPIPPAFDQLREHPRAVPEEIPGLLERLAEVPNLRDPRSVRHALVVVLALTACSLLAGATASGTTPATPADRSPSSDSHDHKTDITRLRRSPATPPTPRRPVYWPDSELRD